MIGNRRTLITIQRLTEEADAIGGTVKTWSTFATVWAERMPLSGREFFAAQAVQAESTVKFRIHHVPGLTPKMRLIDSDTIYDISSVPPPDRKGETVIMARVIDGREI